MSAKTAFPSALVLTALGLCAARGQTPPAMTGYPQTPPPAAVNGSAQSAAPAPGAPDGLPPTPNGPLTGPGRLSDYIIYNRPHGCCGPVGGDGPIGTEIFFRTGPSIVAGGGVFADTLQTGWGFDVGARSLFFDPGADAAWTVTYGISNYTYHGQRPDIQIPLTILVPSPVQNGTPQTVHFGTDVPGVTVRSLNQTFFNLGFGRDWWIFGPAYSCDGPLWRVGADFGGRWGSAKLQLNELRHRTDVIGGVWVGVHSDLEFPCGCGWFVAGFRAEWQYVWSDILQIQNNSDLTTVNLLLNLGYRF
jgi:hypothetical protein